jgi:hypothetical protein
VPGEEVLIAHFAVGAVRHRTPSPSLTAQPVNFTSVIACL